MRENPLKQKLAAGEAVIGTFAKFNDPASAEILALSGFDFFVLDNEHVMFSRETIINILRAAEASGIVPILRVRKNSDIEILQLLDAGAPGVLVPQVNSVAEAQACVSYVKYAPEGRRGFAPTHRAARYGTMDPVLYARLANERTFLGCYCETKEAVQAVEDIARIPDIDVLFIGPMDLSASYGVTGNPKAEPVQNAIAHVCGVCRAAGRAVGTIASNAEEAHALIRSGLQFITISSDQGMLLSKAKEQMAAMKRRLKEVQA